MSERLTPNERELLEIMDGRAPAGTWGAWVTAALEGLETAGYAERTDEWGDIHYWITPAGRAALGEKEG